MVFFKSRGSEAELRGPPARHDMKGRHAGDCGGARAFETKEKKLPGGQGPNGYECCLVPTHRKENLFAGKPPRCSRTWYARAIGMTSERRWADGAIRQPPRRVRANFQFGVADGSTARPRGPALSPTSNAVLAAVKRQRALELRSNGAREGACV